MAAFHLIIYGRFWVITEAGTHFEQIGNNPVISAQRLSLPEGEARTLIRNALVEFCQHIEICIALARELCASGHLKCHLLMNFPFH